MKKIVSILLAVVMVLGMSITSFAENTNAHTITITNPKNGHTYVAYQIFKGDLFTQEDGTEVLTNIEWGSGVVESLSRTETIEGVTTTYNLIDELKAEKSFPEKDKVENGTTTKVSVFDGAETAADVAAALKNFSDDQADKFAEIISKYLSNSGKMSRLVVGTDNEPIMTDAGEYQYKIEVEGDGYYFIKDQGTLAEGDAATRYILQVLANVEMAAKADAPSIDKRIDEDVIVCDQNHDHTAACATEKAKFNNAALGDEVPFIIKSKVPAMDGYEKYYFVVKDTMCQGLTFNDDIVVKVGDEVLTESESNDGVKSYYVKLYDVNGVSTDKLESVRSFEIVFEDFIQYKNKADAERGIEITYSATINSNVIIGTTGNKNEVELKYSNNPNTTDEGTPDEPDYPTPDSPTGDTPKSETITYVTALELKKVDATTGDSLSGAQFTITATTLNKVLVNKTEFLVRADGDTEGPVYYLLKDDTYTTTAPNFSQDVNENTAKYYKDLDDEENPTAVTKTYKMVTTTTTDTANEIEVGEGTDKTTKTYTAYVDGKGILTLEGLSAGTYVIKEIKAPNGYNLLKEEITITVDWTQPADNSTDQKCTWTVVQKGDPDTLLSDVVTDEDGISISTGRYILKVENQSGALLPSTGGIGTTIFYVAGGILVLAAVVLLVTKKRMSAEK